MPVWSSGKASGCKPEDGGSIPSTGSIETLKGKLVMTDFEDIIGKLDPLTDEKRCDILVGNAMRNFSKVKDELGMSDSEFERLHNWVKNKAIPEVMKIYLARMTREEFDVYLQFIQSDIGQAMLDCEIEVNIKFQRMFQLAAPSIIDPIED